MANFIVLASAAVILCVVIYLGLCKRYEDGVLGNAALGCMAFASGTPVYEAIKGHHSDYYPTTILMYAAVAVFMARHAYRFHSYRKTGAGEWRDSDEKIG